MRRVAVFDVGSFFWTLAGARSKAEGAAGLALQVLRYMRERLEKSGAHVAVMASDGPPEAPSRSWRLRIDPEYKGHRAPKDESQRAELVALVGALESAGFPVLAATECDPAGGLPYWFEADDIAHSAAQKIACSSTATQRFEAHIFSNDWDLAQVLVPPSDWVPADHGGSIWLEHVRFFTTRGVERSAADVEREFGCSPAKLAELKALAGDTSDGYKPFPGEAPGKPGIGEKGAADILRAFGSAHSAMAAALSNLDSAFAEKGLPKRIPALLRKGGEEALERGLKLATLRGDVPIPDGFDAGDWEEAEAALLARDEEQERARADALFETGTAAEPQAVDGRLVREKGVLIAAEPASPKIPAASFEHRGEEMPTNAQAAEKLAAAVGSGSIEDLARVVEQFKTEDEALSPEAAAVQEKQALKLDCALAPKTVRVLLTEAEFLAVAPLPAMWSAGIFDIPPDAAPMIGAFIQALADGALRPMTNRCAFIGELSTAADHGLRMLVDLASSMRRGELAAAHWAPFSVDLQSSPRFHALADYSRPLVREK